MNADQILEMVFSDPKVGLERAAEHLATLGADEFEERAATLRAMSLGSRIRNRYQDSIDFARQGAQVAAEGGLEETRLMCLLTMAGSQAQTGQIRESLDVIDDVIASRPETHVLAKFHFQKGFVLQTIGDLAGAVDAYTAALPVFRAGGDTQSVGMTLHNLGDVHTLMGEFEAAESELAEAMQIARDGTGVSTLPGLEHNLGRLAAYRGDIPKALEHLVRSDELYMEISGARYPQHATRCDVLLGAGLFHEAFDLAKLIAEGGREVGDAEHEANALLVAAQAGLLAGHPDQAENLAEAARAEYESQQRDLLAIDATRVVLMSRFASQRASAELLAAAQANLAAYEGEGGLVSVAQARLLVARIAIELGETSLACRTLAQIAAISRGPLEMRIQGFVARALLRLEEGDFRGASVAARSGLEFLDRHQVAVGATDLRAGVERIGVELSEIGIGLALASRRPRRILAWMERTRARALRIRSVVPKGDDETQRLLGNLRRVESDLRKPSNRADRDLTRKRRHLQELITRMERTRRGGALDVVEFNVDRLIETLAGRSLVEIGEHEGRLFAVVVRRGRARMVEIGQADQAVSELSRARFGLRRSARMGRDVDRDTIRRLDTTLVGGIGSLGDEVIVVPPRRLMAAPWAVLPTLRGRAVTISPSAEIWWRAWTRDPGTGPVMVAAGSDLDYANQEVAAVASLYPGAMVLPAGSSVDQVRSGLDGASIAHVVSHASFKVENPMFSSLRLGDGDLNVYDIERLERPADIVVLSACDSGYTETRAGDELAGLTSALLSMGSRNIVASVGLVPDSEATSELMVGFHKGLISGMSAAEALSSAQTRIGDSQQGFLAAASFICVGS